MSDFESTKHPHEPERAPVYDEPGRCLVCVEITLLDQIHRLREEGATLRQHGLAVALERTSLLNALAWHEKATEDPTDADRALWALGQSIADG